jgi:hypothetical protein
MGSTDENGSHWDANTLFDRLHDPTRDRAVHASKNLLLVSSHRKTRSAGYTTLCAFFGRPSTKPAVETTGVRLCRRQQPSAQAARHAPAAGLRRPILVQLRDTTTDAHNIHFDRFQLIDSDFA